ncbi:MAG: hypothetical protein ACRCX2_03965 [Paraclostridium sp.]
MAALKKVFLQFAKKPDGSYQPSVSKQKTTIGAFLVESGSFDTTGINADGTDIDGIRTVLADFFTKSPYTVQGTPLFFFDGTNNLVANISNVIGTALNTKAGLGSLCIFSHLAFSSIKTAQTIGRFQVDGTTVYCNAVKITGIDSSFLRQIVTGGNRLISYSPPSTVDIATETTKFFTTSVFSSTFGVVFEYTKQGIVKVMRKVLMSDPQGSYSFSVFINSQTLQNENDQSLEATFARDTSEARTLICPVVTKSFCYIRTLIFIFPNFTTQDQGGKTYTVSYAQVNNITQPRLFANMGYQTSSTTVDMLTLANAKIGTCAFFPIMGYIDSNYDGYVYENIIFPKNNKLANEQIECSTIGNAYTGHYAYVTKGATTQLVPYKFKIRCGYIIKFPTKIDGSMVPNVDKYDFFTPKTTPYSSGRVVYMTDANNAGKYLYETFNVSVGLFCSQYESPLQINMIVTYDDNSTETKSISVSVKNKAEAYFNLIGDGTHFSSVLKSSLNCVEINESYIDCTTIPDFSSAGIVLTPNATNKKIVKLVAYGTPLASEQSNYIENLFLILSPKT